MKKVLFGFAILMAIGINAGASEYNDESYRKCVANANASNTSSKMCQSLCYAPAPSPSDKKGTVIRK